MEPSFNPFKQNKRENLVQLSTMEKITKIDANTETLEIALKEKKEQLEILIHEELSNKKEYMASVENECAVAIFTKDKFNPSKFVTFSISSNGMPSKVISNIELSADLKKEGGLKEGVPYLVKVKKENTDNKNNEMQLLAVKEMQKKDALEFALMKEKESYAKGFESCVVSTKLLNDRRKGYHVELNGKTYFLDKSFEPKDIKEYEDYLVTTKSFSIKSGNVVNLFTPIFKIEQKEQVVVSYADNSMPQLINFRYDRLVTNKWVLEYSDFDPLSSSSDSKYVKARNTFLKHADNEELELLTHFEGLAKEIGLLENEVENNKEKKGKLEKKAKLELLADETPEITTKLKAEEGQYYTQFGNSDDWDISGPYSSKGSDMSSCTIKLKYSDYELEIKGDSAKNSEDALINAISTLRREKEEIPNLELIFDKFGILDGELVLVETLKEEDKNKVETLREYSQNNEQLLQAEVQDRIIEQMTPIYENDGLNEEQHNTLEGDYYNFEGNTLLGKGVLISHELLLEDSQNPELRKSIQNYNRYVKELRYLVSKGRDHVFHNKLGAIEAFVIFSEMKKLRDVLKYDNVQEVRKSKDKETTNPINAKTTVKANKIDLEAGDSENTLNEKERKLDHVVIEEKPLEGELEFNEAVESLSVGFIDYMKRNVVGNAQALADQKSAPNFYNTNFELFCVIENQNGNKEEVKVFDFKTFPNWGFSPSIIARENISPEDFVKNGNFRKVLEENKLLIINAKKISFVNTILGPTARQVEQAKKEAEEARRRQEEAETKKLLEAIEKETQEKTVETNETAEGLALEYGNLLSTLMNKKNVVEDVRKKMLAILKKLETIDSEKEFTYKMKALKLDKFNGNKINELKL